MSGKLSNIEDDKLLNDILDLYQNRLQQIRNSESGWLGRQRKLLDYIDEKLEGGDRVSRWRMVAAPKTRRLLGQMQTTAQMFQRCQRYIDQGRDIVKRIDAAYPGAGTAKGGRAGLRRRSRAGGNDVTLLNPYCAAPPPPR